MAYIKTNWQYDMIISTEALNNIEQGIYNLDQNKEDKSNMVTDMASYTNSNDKYPTTKAVYDYFFSMIKDVSTKQY